MTLDDTRNENLYGELARFVLDWNGLDWGGAREAREVHWNAAAGNKYRASGGYMLVVSCLVVFSRILVGMRLFMGWCKLQVGIMWGDGRWGVGD